MSAAWDAEGFWTSDDDVEEEEFQVEKESNDQYGDGIDTDTSPHNHETVPAWLRAFEEERSKLDDVVGVSPEYKTTQLPIPTPQVPSPVSDVKKYIRKRWVIEDRRDMSNFDTLLPKEKRAMVHPFELDPFQKRAVLHVENFEHVFVCAHTSAGKTVVAEYAIALAAKNKMRAIYTSPIKALSNQKFREFSQVFESVGIITGDVAVNTQAQCLIMTTEILRSLLYRGDALLSQLAVVVFDEVHYVNDPDRGVVWEETIIMLPASVSMVMLSATVPNYLEFAEWIGTTKQREVFAVSTTYRPTPLRHFLWANDRAYLLMDDKNQFNTKAYNMVYNDARAAQKAKEQRSAAKGKAKAKAKQNFRAPPPKYQTPEARAKTEKQKLQSFLEFLQQKDGLPVVCFCFSRKRCETLADGIPNILNVSQDTRSKLHVFVKQALAGLSTDDQQLPQIKFVQGLLNKGVGVHHGGLLPIVKEMVEILFSKGWIQVLLATETFAMGVNMPARSVLFTAIHKHDGRRMRPLLSSEYIQIAGRAGRRGLDTFGSVYILSASDEPPNHQDLAAMMLHKATPLFSKFRLTFHMLLQLITRQGMQPAEMISRSFRESIRAQQLPIIKRDLIRRQKELESLPSIDCIFGEPDIEEYVKTELHCRQLGHTIHHSLYNSRHVREIFCEGRVCLLHSLGFTTSTCYGIILSRDPKNKPKLTETQDPNARFTRQAFQPDQAHLTMNTEIEHPTFTGLVLIPRGSKFYEEGEIEAFSKLESRHLLRLLTNPSHIEDSNGKIKVIHRGNLLPDSESTLESDVQAALTLGQGHYTPAKEFVVAQSIPLECIGSLLDEVVPLHAVAWGLDESSDPEASTPPPRGGLPVLNESDDDFPAYGKSPNSRSPPKKPDVYTPDYLASGISDNQKLQWNRYAQTFSDLLVQKASSMRTFVLPKKMKNLETDNVLELAELQTLTSKLLQNKCHLCPKREVNMQLEIRRRELLKDIDDLRYTISDSSLDLIPDMMAKIDVLKAFNFINPNGSIALKGRAACEVVATDEISLIEALFNDLFNDKPAEVVVAIVSAFVFPDSNDDEDVIFNEQVEQARQDITALHAHIANEMMRRGVHVDIEDWNRLCSFKFAHVAFRWASGEPFTKVTEKTSLQEGTIVRTIIRLDELIKKLRNVAHLIGNMKLKEVFQEASEKIHRDIVFATSLYVQ